MTIYSDYALDDFGSNINSDQEPINYILPIKKAQKWLCQGSMDFRNAVNAINALLLIDKGSPDCVVPMPTDHDRVSL